MRFLARAFALVSLTALAACATKPVAPPAAPPAAPAPVPPPAPAPAPVPLPPTTGANGREAGVALEQPKVLKSDQAARALQAFLTSCSALTRRQDSSLLTRPSDWTAVCQEAATLQPDYAPGFFYYRFDWVRVGNGQAFATGYYIPEAAGSRTQAPGYTVPVYRTPPDLIRCTRPDGTTGRARIDQIGTCVPYFSRAEIEDGAIAGKDLEIAWAADPVELFFIEIQGSGELRLPDGSVLRIGYDNQNGREYTAIGRLLRDRGILPQGGAHMQAIKDWIRANPEEGKALMRENQSYIFFKELPGPPLGSLGLPITPQGTVAADPKFIPLGAPVFLNMDRPEATGLWVAQDVGGAIKGANRFDTYWGGGPDATRVAGGMSASGQALILLPKGVVARAPAQP